MIDDFLAPLVKLILIVREANPTYEVASEEEEEDYPEGEEHFAVEYVPAVGKVGNRQELQREGYLDKAEHDLDTVHPVARLRC